MPYKYIAQQHSKSFGEAPETVLNALHRLSWAGDRTVKDHSFQKFNELLMVGYFEEQKMSVRCATL